MPDNERPPRPSGHSAPPPEPEEQSAQAESEELTPEERARLSEEALRLLGGGTPLSKEELAQDPYINYQQ